MLKCNWIIVAALGLALVFASPGQAQEQPENEQGEAPQEQSPSEALPLPGPLYIIEDEAAADTRQRSEQEATQREIDDLVAQQGMNVATQAMNDATQRMADFAYAQTWLVGVGTALLFVTLGLTWQANKAAQNAVAVTDRIGKAQVRAYLGFDILSGVVAEGKPVTFNVKVTNHGQSPALKVVISSAAFIRNRDWKWASEGDDIVGQIEQREALLHPSGEIRFVADMEPAVALSADQIARLRADQTCIFADTLVMYEDVFEQCWEATFRFEFSGTECFDLHGPRIAGSSFKSVKRKRSK